MKSIGNIICIIGILVVIFASFLPCWELTYQISGDAAFEAFATEGITDLVNYAVSLN